MRQTRLSIGCRDWQEIVRAIGPEAAGVLIYLRTLMRGIQASEISITVSELAEALRIPSDRAETALAAISPRYLERTDAGDVITLRSPEEAKAMAERRRKQASKIATKCLNGNSGHAPEIPKNEAKSYHTDFFMCYDGTSGKKEKEPRTPQKEKSLTETTGRAPASMHTRDRESERKASSARQQSTAPRVDEIDLPSDQLEADYIDVIGSWPDSLRKAIRAEKEDIREAFYLCIRKRQTDEGRAWSGDQIRMTYLAARRIPEERRAESILAWGMGGWKTIRDTGSGCYFEKTTGRVVSLVRGTVETRSAPIDKQNTDLAARLARNMRRG